MTTGNELLQRRHHHPHTLATQWDWRNVDGKNYITAAQDQGAACLSSTAFAVTSAMNARLRIQLKIALNDPRQILVPDLSVSDLFNCGGGTCAGGQDIETALAYAASKGIVPAYNIPYTPTDPTCRRGSLDLESRVTRISGFNKLASPQTMKDAIQLFGPVIATMRAYQDLRSYKSGVYRWNGSAPFLSDQTVCVIGYNADGWLCKNSWGPSWGMQGVFCIAYGQCGIDARMWEIAGFFATYPYGTVGGTPDAAGKAPLRILYRDIGDRVQYLSAYPPSQDQPLVLDGLAAASDPALASGTGAKSSQLHVIRTDIMGNLQDNVLDKSWSTVQWLTGPDGLTKGPAATGNPSAVGGPWIFYRDADGNIHTVFLSADQWNWLQITGGSGIKAPTAAGDPQISEFGSTLQLCYRDTDGKIQNLQLSGGKWTVKQITGNPPPAAGEPFVTVYNTWLRVLYRDTTGKIVHLWYDSSKWGWEYLPVPAEVVAAGDPVATDYGSSIHIFYRESRGFIWHLYWYGGRWNGEQLTGPGLSGGELAEGEPTAVSFGNEIHVLYRDIYDNLSDAYWTGTTWTHLVRI